MPAVLRSLELTRLTATQQRVAERIAAGQSNREAAAALGMRTGTLSRHVTSIGYRFSVSSRPAKVHVAIDSGQIQAPACPGEAPDFTEADLSLLRAVAVHSEIEQIAASARISPPAVKSRLQDLVKKAAARNSAHLVGLGHAWGLFENGTADE